MMPRVFGIVAILGVLALIGASVVGLYRSSVRNAVDAAVSSERRERLDDGIELIRRTDVLLNVTRKASNADLCRALGGEKGECE